MILLIDIGNTNIVYSLYDGNNYIINKRIAPEENIQNIINYLSNYTINHIAIASVVPKITSIYLKLFKEKLNIESFVVSYQNANINLMIDSKKEVGSDRLCNVKAAIEKTKRNCIVIDFGTATTINIVSKDSEFIGGFIGLGFTSSLKALAKRAVQRFPSVSRDTSRSPRAYFFSLISICRCNQALVIRVFVWDWNLYDSM